MFTKMRTLRQKNGFEVLRKGSIKIVFVVIKKKLSLKYFNFMAFISQGNRSSLLYKDYNFIH